MMDFEKTPVAITVATAGVTDGFEVVLVAEDLETARKALSGLEPGNYQLIKVVEHGIVIEEVPTRTRVRRGATTSTRTRRS